MMSSESTVDTQQTITDHLAELRSRLIYSMLAVAAGAAFAFVFSDKIFDLVRAPIAPFIEDGAGGLVFTGVMDKFLAHIKLSLLAGVILSCPIWLYQLWKFVAPGLYSHERKYALGFIGSGSFLFMTGISFVYFLVYPLAFDYLLAFGGTTDKPMITIDQYLSFFVTTTLLFGLAFELPLVLVILGIMGIIDQKFLREKRRYSIVFIAILSGVITPPDILSMVVLMVPLVLLYEISIILVGVFGRAKETESLNA